MADPFLQNHRLLLSTLSPVHIGCGVDYQPTHYLMDEGLLYAFDPVAALAPDAEARAELLEIVSQPQGDVVRAIQRYFRKRKETLIPRHTRRVPVGIGVQAFYDERIGNQAKPNQLHIERMAHSPINEQIVLPGSSLKGALRTALLDGVHGGAALVNPKDAENTRTSWKELAPIPHTLGAVLPPQFERDPMRLIRVGDTRLQREESHNEILFAVNRKPSGEAGKGPYQTLECLSPLTLESFVADIAFLNLEQAREYDKHADKKGLPPENHRWNAAAVVQACNTYYRAHLQRELTELEGMLDPQWARTIRDSLESGSLGRLLDRGRAFLLRIGRHSGAESVTLNGARHIKIMQGPRNPPSWGNRATTVWMAARETNQLRDLLPFGWLLAEWDEEGRSPLAQRAPELAVLAQGFALDRTKALDASDARLVRLREQDAAKRREEAQRQAELARQAAENRQREEQRARMTPNQHALDRLKGLLAQEEGRQTVGGLLWMETNRLVSDAEKGGWSREEIQELSLVCRTELPGKLKNADKKVKEMHLRLDNLRSTDS
ncbi:MAG: hypothetical protein HQL51_05185 [Magnetococcales bacterium]|nr:hypothetical protein [Magnetococcales bacterium]